MKKHSPSGKILKNSKKMSKIMFDKWDKSHYNI